MILLSQSAVSPVVHRARELSLPEAQQAVSEMLGYELAPSNKPHGQPRPRYAASAPPLDDDRLNEVRPLRWVFAGDSLMAGQMEERHRLTPLASALASVIVRHPARHDDQMVDVLTPGISIPRLVSAWETRVAIHRPDVLVLFCGHSDAVAGMRGFHLFEDSLVEMLTTCRDAGITPIINTPPCLPQASDSQLADVLIYLEALRAEAAAHNAILVDHWAHWEWTAVEMGGTEVWYDDSGRFPGPRGHRQMARTFLNTLGLNLTLSTS